MLFLRNIFIGLFCVLFFNKALAQSVVFNKVFNDFSYTKTSTSGNTLYNNDYLYVIKEFHLNEYTFYGRSANHTYLSWEDSLYSYSYNVDLDEFGDTIRTTRLNMEDKSIEATFEGLKVNQSEYLIGVSNNTLVGFEEYNGTFIKLDNNKDTVYRKEFDYGEDTKFVTIKTNDNGTTFQVLAFADTSTSSIDYNAFISTIDSNGNLISNIEFGGAADDILYGLEYLNNGNYLVCGHTFSQGLGISDIWLLEIALGGSIVWEKTYGTVYYDRIENSKGLLIYDDHIYIAGRSAINVTGSATASGYLIKTDMIGNLVWEKKFSKGEDIETFVSFDMWDNFSFVVGGTTSSYGNDNDYPVGWLLKIDTSGNVIWEREVAKYKDQTNLVHHYPADMLVTQDRGILLGGYIIANSVVDINGYFHRNDAWLAKTDSCGFTTGDIPEPMFLIDSIIGKTVYLTDQSTNYCTANLDWGDGTEESYYAYENNLPLSEKHFSHTYSQTGYYTIRTTALAGEEFRDYEVEILNLSTSDIFNDNGSISLFPNPADDYVIVQGKHTPNPSQEGNVRGQFVASVFDLNGKQVMSINLNHKLYQQKLDVSELNNGVYYVSFEVEGVFVATEKLVVTR